MVLLILSGLVYNYGRSSRLTSIGPTARSSTTPTTSIYSTSSCNRAPRKIRTQPVRKMSPSARAIHEPRRRRPNRVGNYVIDLGRFFASITIRRHIVCPKLSVANSIQPFFRRFCTYIYYLRRVSLEQFISLPSTKKSKTPIFLLPHSRLDFFGILLIPQAGINIRFLWKFPHLSMF